MKTTSTRKTVKRSQPYRRPNGARTSSEKLRSTPTPPSPTPSATLSSSSSSSSSTSATSSQNPAFAATPSSTTPVEYAREVYTDSFQKKYPGLTPRNDYELLMLGSKKHNGTTAEMLAWVESRMEYAIKEHGSREAVLAVAKKILDGVVGTTGRKPRPGRDIVHIQPLPDSKYSIRLWPGNPYVSEYCMDFVDTATKQAVNSPFEFELWAVPNPAAPWLCMPAGSLRSLEQNFGIAQHKILPGEEKWVLRDGQTCLLKRPGMKDVMFTVPMRRQARPPATYDVHVLNFPKEV